MRLARFVAAASISIALAQAAAFAAPAAAPALAPAAAPAEPGAFQTGVASWYGADFHGRRTSNGEIYDKEKLTCAHRSLAFGSYVLVANLDNGSSVVVRVNDRGPFAKDRIIDLSEAAARIIGMIPTGTARVSLTLLPREEALAWKGGPIAGDSGRPPAGGEALASAGAGSSGTVAQAEASPLASVPPDARVRIQVASYSSESNAKATLGRLAASGLSAAIEASGGHYRVLFADLSPEQARAVALKLDGLGYRGYSVTTILPAR
jgi:rare lipoprotein A